MEILKIIFKVVEVTADVAVIILSARYLKKNRRR